MAQIYLVTYTLRTAGINPDRRGEIEKIIVKRSTDRIRIGETDWLLYSTKNTASSIYNNIRAHLEKQDSLFVANIGEEYEATDQAVLEWIQKYI